MIQQNNGTASAHLEQSNRSQDVLDKNVKIDLQGQEAAEIPGIPGVGVVMYESELCRLAEQTLTHPDTEIGGDCFGLFARSGSFMIQYVLDAGPNARCLPAVFFQDKQYLRKHSQLLYHWHGLMHHANWHSHRTFGLTKPSGGDVRTMDKALKRSGVGCFCCLITNIVSDESVTVRAYAFMRKKSGTYLQLPVHVLPGISPFRARIPSEQNHNWNIAACADDPCAVQLTAVSETTSIVDDNT